MSSSPKPPKPQMEIIEGRYQLIRKIGTGSMGAVFEARSLSTNVRVAIKLINTRLQDEWQFRARFEREAAVAADVKSPYCAEVVEFGQCADGRMFLVMELLQGESLADHVSRHGALGLDDALRVMAQILQGLEVVHDAGFIHRDIKPENIFLHQPEEGPLVSKIVDFGIAKPMNESAASSDNLTSVGMVLGTPLYIAPDWMLHDVVDGRSDIYSLTVTLFETLTGQPPFQDDDSNVIMSKHLLKNRPSLAERRPEQSFPNEVEEIVRKGWCLDRDDRYRDAATMRASIAAYLAAHGQQAPSAPQHRFEARDPSTPAVSQRSSTTQSGSERMPFWGYAVIAVLVTFLAGFLSTMCQSDSAASRQQAEEWWHLPAGEGQGK